MLKMIRKTSRYVEPSNQSNGVDFLNNFTDELAKMEPTNDYQEASGIEMIKERIKELSLEEIKEIIRFCQQVIKDRQENEVSEIDRQIAELLAKKQAITGKHSVKSEEAKRTRDIKPIINPSNTAEKYIAGRIPEWLGKILKDKLGNNYDNNKIRKAEILKMRGQQQ